MESSIHNYKGLISNMGIWCNKPEQLEKSHANL